MAGLVAAEPEAGRAEALAVGVVTAAVTEAEEAANMQGGSARARLSQLNVWQNLFRTNK